MKEYDNWEDLDRRIWDLIRKMTAGGIPYRHPMKGRVLANMKQHNPAGYAMLDEYWKLIELEKEMKA